MADIASKFIKIKRVGKGSFGQVFKAINNETQQIVAIKEINLEADDDDISELQKEIQVLSHCDCPYITRYHTSYSVGIHLWIVMDYCGIGSLRHLV
ncbi:kinase-like protein, partial [Rozella allomycis CSF55]